jgi:hypothetical protein
MIGSRGIVSGARIRIMRPFCDARCATKKERKLAAVATVQHRARVHDYSFEERPS